MKIKDNGDWIELKVIVEKFKKKLIDVKVDGKPMKDEFGKKVKEEIDVFVREIIVPTRFMKDGITLSGKTLNHQYRVQETKSTIFDKYTNKHYVVKHTLDELEEGLKKRSIVGFQVGLQNNK